MQSMKRMWLLGDTKGMTEGEVIDGVGDSRTVLVLLLLLRYEGPMSCWPRRRGKSCSGKDRHRNQEKCQGAAHRSWRKRRTHGASPPALREPPTVAPTGTTDWFESFAAADAKGEKGRWWLVALCCKGCWLRPPCWFVTHRDNTTSVPPGEGSLIPRIPSSEGIRGYECMVVGAPFVPKTKKDKTTIAQQRLDVPEIDK